MQEQDTGYTIVITGYLLKDPESFGKDEFAAARLAMTCCVADIAPAGVDVQFSDYGIPYHADGTGGRVCVSLLAAKAKMIP